MATTRNPVWAVLLVAGVISGIGIRMAMAQGVDNFPSRPIVVVVPAEGSGTTHMEMRLFAESVKERTGKAIVVESKGGAGMTIGTAYVAKARPDGYTLLVPSAAFAMGGAIYPNLPYDNIRDFEPITLLVKHVFLFLVHPSSPFKSMRDYIAYARTHPGELNFSTSGLGGVTHLCGELLHYMTKTNATFVHYKVSSQRLVDVTAGRVHASITAPVSALPMIKAGRLRALGITSAERIALLPDMPTIAEQGVPGFEYSSWVGLAAPARTPPAIINTLNEMWVQAVKDPGVIKKLEGDGTIMVGNTPAQFREFIVSETKRWHTVIKATGVKIEAD